MSVDLDDPIALMLAAAAALDRSGIDAAAYGGLTLAMYGEPRETRDADLAVASIDIEQARVGLAELGVDVVIAFAGVTFGGCRVARLTLVGRDQLNTVDLVTPRSSRYARAVLQRAVRGSLRGQELRVTSPEDFVILKILATRERDLEDARSVVTKQRSRLDEQMIRTEIDQLIVEVPDHQIRQRLEMVMS